MSVEKKSIKNLSLPTHSIPIALNSSSVYSEKSVAVLSAFFMTSDVFLPIISGTFGKNVFCALLENISFAVTCTISLPSIFRVIRTISYMRPFVVSSIFSLISRTLSSIGYSNCRQAISLIFLCSEIFTASFKMSPVSKFVALRSCNRNTSLFIPIHLA